MLAAAAEEAAAAGAGADAGGPGRYCEGDDVSMADVFLLPQVYNAVRFKLDMTRWPTVARIAAALELLPAFADAHPSRQPDADPDAA
jgi:glutathione S-transferase